MTARSREQTSYRATLLGRSLVGGLLSGLVSAGEPLSFNRDIRPILAEACWKCHGFDARARSGGLRLDERDAAIGPADSGLRAIVPGQPEASELLERLTTTDPDRRMPPPTEARRVSPAEIERLRQWIAEGAVYQRHWAFEPIVTPEVPADMGEPHPIDAFVAATHRAVGQTFADEADRDTLIRRVWFDLLGLPPTERELQEARTESWDAIVDRLLASPHFGERMAVDWLDAARYADTDGYFGDKPRQMWLWRDWVIDAYNRNLPFDQFTIEQLAGDLLPEATVAQRIATGFNRNHMSNDETGLIDEEYRVEYVADRVETTTATWLGLTVACAQCHDHKYDPLSQREYYQLFAFFNNVPENGLLLGHDAPPRIEVPTAEQQAERTRLTAETTRAQTVFEPLRAQAQAELTAREAELLAAVPPELGVEPTGFAASLEAPFVETVRALGTPLEPVMGVRGQGLRFDATQHLEVDTPGPPLDGPWTVGLWLSSENSLGAPLSKIEPRERRRGLELLWQKGRLGLHLVHDWGGAAIEVRTREPLPTNRWHQVVVTYDGSRRAAGVALFVDGRPVDLEVRNDTLTGTITNEEPWRIARRDEGLGFYGSLDELRLLPRRLSDVEIAAWSRGERTRGILERPAGERSGRDVEWLLDEFIDSHAPVTTRHARDALHAARTAEAEQRAAIPLALVMADQPTRRPTHVLERGQYSQPGELVEPGTPAVLSAWNSEWPRDRLGFARWLVSADHPLTARVAVNRLWRQCFGEGLVRTPNDFGTQGEPPTHPELLDYLAATYRRTWDTKGLLKLIVTSRTYRQRSAYRTRDGELIDPANRWLARGPRFRLPLESIRDQALVASGLLVPRVGGPSVKPWQPPGLWEEVSYNAEASYEVDAGAGSARRSLYTYHKRQAPPPALLIFDGPTREKCTLQRPRTNTPLQALVLLNDETYVIAARAVAADLLAKEGADEGRIGSLFRRIVSRDPTDIERTRTAEFLTTLRAHYAADPAAAAQVCGWEATAEMSSVDRAAWTVLAQTMFNLDEAITRQ